MPATQALSPPPSTDQRGFERVSGGRIDIGAFELPGPIRGDLDQDGDVDRNDLVVILAARNKPASGPNDPRDLDKDGRITVLDARILVTLFTTPGGVPQ